MKNFKLVPSPEWGLVYLYYRRYYKIFNFKIYYWDKLFATSYAYLFLNYKDKGKDQMIKYVLNEYFNSYERFEHKLLKKL